MVNSNKIFVVLDLDDLLVDWSELLSVECWMRPGYHPFKSEAARLTMNLSSLTCKSCPRYPGNGRRGPAGPACGKQLPSWHRQQPPAPPCLRNTWCILGHKLYSVRGYQNKLKMGERGIGERRTLGRSKLWLPICYLKEIYFLPRISHNLSHVYPIQDPSFPHEAPFTVLLL